MHSVHRIIYRLSSTALSTSASAARFLKEQTRPKFGNGNRVALVNGIGAYQDIGSRLFSAKSGGSEGGDDWDSAVGSFGGSESVTDGDGLGWGSASSWSTGLTKDHFDGVEVVGQRTTSSTTESGKDGGDGIKDTSHAAFVAGWDKRIGELQVLMDQIKEPGLRGSYLKDSEKAEMYRLHKENPEVYTVEKLAKDYRIMRQRVHAILWLKEIEEEEEKKLGHPLDDSIELLLDNFPEFFKSHDREFHVASLSYKPDFKVMPEGWDGTIKDMDEVHYEISKKEDEILYQEFVLRMKFNKMKMTGQVKCHKYSRRRSSEGWSFTVEKMGKKGKRGGGGGWKFVSLPDGSSRPLNETEKLYVKRETPRRRRRLIA
ncbi:hypothetical protein OIU77_003045 [Salix suchowensis]|uniref:Uncharacterized protein n=1 Tax=Salix suchowensis TaxID=1278906 RepID=A0ABQ9B195_9ROSI|nr:hypothetical protein OIU77_003045 [Salix suchowensis]